MKQCADCKLWGPSEGECRLAPPGPDHAVNAEKRVVAVENAYAQMRIRGWMFKQSNAQQGGFGDPTATMTFVGPHVGGGMIDVVGIDTDAVEAVRKAIEAVDRKQEAV